MTIPREVLAITLALVAALGSGCDLVGPTCTPCHSGPGWRRLLERLMRPTQAT